MGNDREGGSSIDQLVIGTAAMNSLHDENGLLLVAEGVVITEPLIESLRRRGISTVYQQPPDDESVSSATTSASASTRPAPRRATQTRASQKPDSAKNDSVFGSLSRTYSPQKMERIRVQFEAGEKAIQHLCQTFGRSQIKSLRRVDACVDDYVRELVDDADPVVAAAIAYQKDLPLARRCVQLAILSLAIADQVQIRPDQRSMLGTAALIHDWSLFDAPPSARYPQKIQNDDDRRVYRQHPIETARMLDTIEDLPRGIRTMVEQVHEHFDGSGFPHGLHESDIQRTSQIIGVADAYLTMTSPPQDSPRVVPCDAVAFMINAAAKGRYWSPAVRGLLRTVTLYPLGSVVELSDASRAVVVRSNGQDYGYPIVASMTDAAKIINLKDSDLFVTRPILSPESRDVRLVDTHLQLMDAIGQLKP